MEQKPRNSSNSLAILGVVFGFFCIIFSFIPCIGFWAFIPAIAFLIVSIVALNKARSNGESVALPVIGISLSGVACVVSFIQVFSFVALFSSPEMKEVRDAFKEGFNQEFLDSLKNLGEDVDYDSLYRSLDSATYEVEVDSTGNFE